MGVTTGQLLCACVGSASRAEYTVYGDAINLSARLMVCACGMDAAGHVLCDFTTQQLGARAAAYTRLELMQVRQNP